MKLKILFLLLFILSTNLFSQNTEENKENISFAIIDKAPVYPGCNSKNNTSLKKCMSKEINDYVTKNYDTSIIQKTKLKQGKHKILVSFMINKNGKVTNIKAKGSVPELEIEAIRVVNSLPLMEPGIHNGKKVNVIYTLPIMFQNTK